MVMSVLVALQLLSLVRPAGAETPSSSSTKTEEDAVTKVRKYLLTRTGNMPNRLERLIVAGLGAGASVAGLGVGIGFGIWAWMDHRCLSNVPACNETRPSDRQIEGTGFLAARADGERKALYADMGYLAAVTFAAVAGLSVAAAFWPAGWWPFASADLPDVVPPTTVVTEIPPSLTPPEIQAPAPEPTPAAPPAGVPSETPPAAPEPAIAEPPPLEETVPPPDAAPPMEAVPPGGTP
jgi:hypothetical protein